MVNQATCTNAYAFLAEASKSAEGIVPPYFSALVWIVHKIHRLWLFFRFSLDYTNSEHQPLLATGHALYFFSSNNSWMQKTAKTLFVSRLLMEWTAMARRCTVAYRNFQKGFLFDELFEEKKEPLNSFFFSVSTASALERKKRCLRKILDAVKRFWLFLKALFFLFVQSLDIMAAYSSSEQHLWIHSRHIFVNGYETARLFYQEFSVIAEHLKSENTTLARLSSFLGMKSCVTSTCAFALKNVMSVFVDTEVSSFQEFNGLLRRECNKKRGQVFCKESVFFPLDSQLANDLRLDV